jgi:hypothetical protein
MKVVFLIILAVSCFGLKKCGGGSGTLQTPVEVVNVQR